MEREKILKKVHSSIMSTFNVDFIPHEDFQRSYNLIEQNFLKVMKPLEKEYIALKKGNSVNSLFVDKIKFIRTRLDMNPLPVLMFPHQDPTEKKRQSYTGRDIEEYTRRKLWAFNDTELKERCGEEYKRLEAEYDRMAKSEPNSILIPLLLFAYQKQPLLFKGAKYAQAVQDESADKMFQEYLTRFTEIPTHFNFIDNSPEYLLKGFYEGYVSRFSRYQNLLQNTANQLRKEDLMLVTDFVVNIGHVTFSKVNTAYGVRINNTYEIFRRPKPSFIYKETNDPEEADSDIVNIILLNHNGELLRLCIYDEGLLKRNRYNIRSNQIQQIDVIRNSIVRAHPHKHFDPVTVVFDISDEALSFERKLSKLKERNTNPRGR